MKNTTVAGVVTAYVTLLIGEIFIHIAIAKIPEVIFFTLILGGLAVIGVVAAARRERKDRSRR